VAATALFAAAVGIAGAVAGLAAEPPFASYVPPSGPEYSEHAAADLAVRFARLQAGDPASLHGEIALGTLTDAEAVVHAVPLARAREQEARLRAWPPSPNFCFTTCTEAEERQAKKRLYEAGQARSYLVVVTGGAYSPPHSVPPHCRHAPRRCGGSYRQLVLVLDAHTGDRIVVSAGPVQPLRHLTEMRDAHRLEAPRGETTAILTRIAAPRLHRRSG
jgi:hypothetical protein